MRARHIFTAALAALSTGIVPVASAADLGLGPLRGTHYGSAMGETQVWQGVYFGGFGGTTNGSTNFDGTLRDTVANLMRGTVIENEMQVSEWLRPPQGKPSATNFGIFAGYNYQFDEIVAGFELDYTRTRLTSTGTDSLRRFQTTSNNFTNSVTVNGSVSAELKDLATLRARAGYTIGSFLPFVTAGLALTNYEVSRSATVFGTQTPTGPGAVVPFNSVAPTETAKGVGFGMTFGAGVDVALTENSFVRAEWQHIHFPDLAGVRTILNNFRAGAGVRF